MTEDNLEEINIKEELPIFDNKDILPEIDDVLQPQLKTEIKEEKHDNHKEQKNQKQSYVNGNKKIKIRRHNNELKQTDFAKNKKRFKTNNNNRNNF